MSDRIRKDKERGRGDGEGGGMRPEPVFVNFLWSLGIDSQPGGLVRQLYLSYRPARLHRLAESGPRNRFLGSINVYKYGLCLLCAGSPYKLDARYV
jgi:hypothetical protein